MSPDIRPNSVRNPISERRSRVAGGAALIAIGLLLLFGSLVDVSWFGLLFLPLLGLIFLLWGAGARNAGLMIPGGILSGIGQGLFLTEGPLAFLKGDQVGAVFLLCFGAGWMLITLLTALFTDETHRWPLIPGSILALIGGSLLAGGIALDVVRMLGEIINRLWPAALIGFGLYLLIRRPSAQE